MPQETRKFLRQISQQKRKQARYQLEQYKKHLPNKRRTKYKRQTRSSTSTQIADPIAVANAAFEAKKTQALTLLNMAIAANANSKKSTETSLPKRTTKSSSKNPHTLLIATLTILQLLGMVFATENTTANSTALIGAIQEPPDDVIAMLNQAVGGILENNFDLENAMPPADDDILNLLREVESSDSLTIRHLYYEAKFAVTKGNYEEAKTKLETVNKLFISQAPSEFNQENVTELLNTIEKITEQNKLWAEPIPENLEYLVFEGQIISAVIVPVRCYVKSPVQSYYIDVGTVSPVRYEYRHAFFLEDDGLFGNLINEDLEKIYAHVLFNNFAEVIKKIEVILDALPKTVRYSQIRGRLYDMQAEALEKIGQYSKMCRTLALAEYYSPLAGTGHAYISENRKKKYDEHKNRLGGEAMSLTASDVVGLMAGVRILRGRRQQFGSQKINPTETILLFLKEIANLNDGITVNQTEEKSQETLEFFLEFTADYDQKKIDLIIDLTTEKLHGYFKNCVKITNEKIAQGKYKIAIEIVNAEETAKLSNPSRTAKRRFLKEIREILTRETKPQKKAAKEESSSSCMNDETSPSSDDSKPVTLPVKKEKSVIDTEKPLQEKRTQENARKKQIDGLLENLQNLAKQKLSEMATPEYEDISEIRDKQTEIATLCQKILADKKTVEYTAQEVETLTKQKLALESKYRDYVSAVENYEREKSRHESEEQETQLAQYKDSITVTLENIDKITAKIKGEKLEVATQHTELLLKNLEIFARTFFKPNSLESDLTPTEVLKKLELDQVYIAVKESFISLTVLSEALSNLIKKLEVQRDLLATYEEFQQSSPELWQQLLSDLSKTKSELQELQPKITEVLKINAEKAIALPSTDTLTKTTYCYYLPNIDKALESLKDAGFIAACAYQNSVIAETNPAISKAYQLALELQLIRFFVYAQDWETKHKSRNCSGTIIVDGQYATEKLRNLLLHCAYKSDITKNPEHIFNLQALINLVKELLPIVNDCEAIQLLEDHAVCNAKIQKCITTHLIPIIGLPLITENEHLLPICKPHAELKNVLAKTLIEIGETMKILDSLPEFVRDDVRIRLLLSMGEIIEMLKKNLSHEPENAALLQQVGKIVPGFELVGKNLPDYLHALRNTIAHDDAPDKEHTIEIKPQDISSCFSYFAANAVTIAKKLELGLEPIASITANYHQTIKLVIQKNFVFSEILDMEIIKSIAKKFKIIPEKISPTNKAEILKHFAEIIKTHRISLPCEKYHSAIFAELATFVYLTPSNPDIQTRTPTISRKLQEIAQKICGEILETPEPKHATVLKT